MEKFRSNPTNLPSSQSWRPNFHEGAVVLVFRTIVSRCCWTIVERQIMDNHGSIARSGNNDHEYFSLLHNASMARYSSSRVITAALRRIHVAIRTRRCASRAHRWIQHWNRSLETEHIRSLSPHITSPPHLFQNLPSSVNDDLFLFISLLTHISFNLRIREYKYFWKNISFWNLQLFRAKYFLSNLFDIIVIVDFQNYFSC